jgi:RNA polymerase sigma-70 factor (ECF subfamily)
LGPAPGSGRVPEDDIQALVERARHGDTAAVGALYDAFAPRVYRFFRFRVSADEPAEDLMQRVFLKMIEQLPKYEPRGVPFAAWLFRVARNTWIDEGRAYHATVPLEAIDSELADTGDPETLTEASLDGELIRSAVATLPDDQREVIACRFFAGLTPRETAELMGRSEGSVRVLQHRALGALRRRLPPLENGRSASQKAGRA